MMWVEESRQQLDKRLVEDDSDEESDTTGEEIPIWIRGEQRWVSGIVGETTCRDVVSVLLQDEESRGRHVNSPDQYHITERWRGVEQPLDPNSSILDIWTAWGRAQPEVKISLRRIKSETISPRRTRYRTDSGTWSDRNSWKTIHPKRLNALQNENAKQPSSTEELLKLVLAQGEVIRKQLKKLRHSEHQIGFLEDKAHRARVRKHGSNYLLETYLKGLSEAVDPEADFDPNSADKHSDSGVVTEGDSEQSNHKKAGSSSESPTERFSPSSEDSHKDLLSKDDDSNSSASESNLHERLELFEAIGRLNKKLLKEEERLVRLSTGIRKHEEAARALGELKRQMAKGACELQHNEVVLEETREMLEGRRGLLDGLRRDLAREDREFELLRTLAGNSRDEHQQPYGGNFTKELLDTLV